MIEHGMYYLKNELYDLIRQCGGLWDDPKIRPVYCCFKSVECKGLFWAIPVGRVDHRNQKALERIRRFMSYPDDDLRSCYYHVGNTDVESIFFVSRAIPVIDKYLDREYLNRYNGKIHIVKNKVLIQELERKLGRILSFENHRPDYFQQKIISTKKVLLEELDNK